MKVQSIILSLTALASGHSIFQKVSVNGVDQGDGRTTYIRSPPTNDPVRDLSSPDCKLIWAKEVKITG